MPYSDDKNDYWKVRKHSIAEGFVVQNRPVLSEDTYIIAHTLLKADAEMIASLLNRAGVKRDA